ncbi:hypothetical protein [Streptomyces echinatus]|uniref:Uncharacterized protein n=1 Tax=Streptomyces echinatus TaxID=67293 RepID=A0A7W9PUB8_9ACTN|nr:hypothetical protein [Streptomyces echinatus]MBB5927598.1 hypothetical protein [Streptomyces echinatus]
MSTEQEHEAGAYGMDGTGGTPGVRPNVYQPLPSPAPAYDAYADPAAAHGWQNAYDETRELPPVPSEPVPPGPGEGRAALRRARRRPGGRRRVAVVAGALGVAGTVAVIAGLTGGGAPDGSRPADGRVAGGPTADDDGPATSAPVATVPAAPAPAVTGPATSAPGAPVRSAEASPSGTAGLPSGGTSPSAGPGEPDGSPSAPATASTDPTPTVSSTGPTTSHPGHGHGHGRWPR